MKRTRVDEDFNPVYPYDAESSPSTPFVTPPFTSSNGFTESPPGVLTLNCTPPLTTNDGALTLNIEGGLQVNANKKLQIIPNVSKGITLQNNAIAVKLGNDLKFNSDGQITLNPITLWTAPSEAANCTLYGSSANFFLCLTKNDSHVVGTVSLTGLTGKFLNMTENNVTVQLAFDDYGNLTSSPLTPNVWGIRQQNSSGSVTGNMRQFMPNSTVYPREGSGKPRNNLYFNTFLRGNPNKPITLTLTLNSLATGYTLTFKWGTYYNEAFSTPTTSFCYVAEQ
nr:short fiber 2 [Rhesus adenovirus 71]WUR08071.1 short fiber 2 [Rhesus adenovirus 72]WUR08095.1 short fiber 2 [Rhesus adenovirus 73]